MAQHQESDEEMAARLQQEELGAAGYGGVAQNAGMGVGAGGGGDGAAMPILQRLRPGLQRQDNRAVHRNLAQNLQEVREHSPRVFAVTMTATALEVVTTAVVLAIYWNADCDKNLQLWLAVFTARQFVLFPLNVSGYLRHRPRVAGGPPLPPPNVIAASDAWEQKVRGWINFLTFVWFIVGQSWVYSSDTCKSTAPALYTYSLILIICVYITIAFPIILVLCLCLCFPCVLLFFRVFAEPEGAQPAAIQQLPTRVYQTPLPAAAGGAPPPVNPEDAPSCAICMESYNNGDRLRALPCRHEFHNACVDHWLTIRDTCPLCRHKISEAMDPAVPKPAASASAAAAAGTRVAAIGVESKQQGNNNNNNNNSSSRSPSGGGADRGAGSRSSSGSGSVLLPHTIAVRPASGSTGSTDSNGGGGGSGAAPTVVAMPHGSEDNV